MVNNFVFAGVGIAVFTGAGPGVTGTQPYNGLVISYNPGSGTRFRFGCRSNSLTVGVGDLVGLDDSPIDDEASNFFSFGSTNRAGELSVINDVGAANPLTANEQGVYTCRMPFEGGGEGETNIGVYPSGFSGELIC